MGVKRAARTYGRKMQLNPPQGPFWVAPGGNLGEYTPLRRLRLSALTCAPHRWRKSGRSRLPVSAITQNNNTMTDTNPSGEMTAPVADPQAPAVNAATPAASFGSTRGSGLARGKRPSSAAAPARAPVKSDYKPTSVAIITPEREYKNPFASPEPAIPPTAEPAKVETPVAETAPAPAAEVAAAVTEPTPAPAPVAQPEVVAQQEPTVQTEPEPIAEKSEIQILPPAESVRPAVSWESPSALRKDQPSGERTDRPQRDDRPTFRADRREDRPQTPRAEGGEPRRDSFQRDGRQPRDPREPRQPRDPREARQPRDPRDYPQYEQRPRGDNPASAESSAPQKKGFIAWLKGLFGGTKPSEAPAPADGAGEQFGGGHRHRRRHRGGRGGSQGFRGDRFSAGGERQPGAEHEDRGERHDGGHRRRRHRGGRGRDRGGDNRSQEPRAAGQSNPDASASPS